MTNLLYVLQNERVSSELDRVICKGDVISFKSSTPCILERNVFSLLLHVLEEVKGPPPKYIRTIKFIIL